MNTPLLPIGTRVIHDGHGPGTIVALNSVQPSGYVASNLGKAPVNEAVALGLGQAVMASMYSNDRFPYVVHFDPSDRFPDGYKDVYDVDGHVMKVLA